jgi:Tfp pilus assembly protein PilP
MTTTAEIQKQNEELARTINEEAMRNPQSPYIGKYVGIVNGQVVVVSDDLDDLDHRLRAIGANPRELFCLAVGSNTTETEIVGAPRCTAPVLSAPLTEIQKRNQELADRINQEARRNPQSPYAGKFVGIANGQVVVVTEALDELARLLRQAEPNPQNTFCIEASRDYTKADYIWELR